MWAKAVVLIMLTITLSSTVDFAFVSRVHASNDGVWWDAAWKYRRKLVILENSGFALANFPLVSIFEHYGNVQPDGDDVRIVSDGVEIPSYVMDLKESCATVMFQFNASASATKSVYVYYGNSGAQAPNYPDVSLSILEGLTGHAVIDSMVYVGWEYTKWGWDGDNSNVTIWVDYRIDFDGNGDPTDDDDLIRDVPYRRGGIGRFRNIYGNTTVRAIGLGEYESFLQTPLYIDINFAHATLTVFRSQTFVKTKQADELQMFSSEWDYAKYGTGLEQHTTDGGSWETYYSSPENPGYMAFRNSDSGMILGVMGLKTSGIYGIAAKEDPDWDRYILLDLMPTSLPQMPLKPYNQFSDTEIYWYGDDTNSYISIEMTAAILRNQPSLAVGEEGARSMTFDEVLRELNNTRNFLYVFMVATVVFVVTTAYFATKLRRLARVSSLCVSF